MTTNPNLQRAQLLLEQSRPKEAEDYARQGIQDEPDNPYAYYLLSSALLQQDREDDALPPAQAALERAPDNPQLHFHLAIIHYNRRQYKAAREAADRSLQIYPENPDAFGLLALLAARSAAWRQSLEYAESGLAYDSDHVTCTNARANALVKLKRPDLAHESLDYALQRDPDNPLTHYQKARSLMETGRYDEAARHYCEALRLEPDFAEAKEGLVEALKARHWVYSLFLKYLFFMGRLAPRTQMIIVFGGFFAQRIAHTALTNAGHPGPALAVRIVYGVLVYFTWTAPSLFNLLLFLHPLGRHALSDLQKRVAAGVGASILAALACAAAALTVGPEDALVAAIAFATLTLPLASLNQITRPRSFKTVTAICAGHAILTLVGTALVFLAPSPNGADLLMIPILVGVAYTWLSSFFTR